VKPEELYQEVMLRHSKEPCNCGAAAEAPFHGKAVNRACGDEIELGFAVEDSVVVRPVFSGQACAIATASASLLTEVIKGKELAHVRSLAVLVEEGFGLGEMEDAALREALAEHGELAALIAVRAFPGRVGCALLPWKALRKAMDS
jgi:nitrogen fixation NifU-like protein